MHTRLGQDVFYKIGEKMYPAKVLVIERTEIKDAEGAVVGVDERCLLRIFNQGQGEQVLDTNKWARYGEFVYSEDGQVIDDRTAIEPESDEEGAPLV